MEFNTAQAWSDSGLFLQEPLIPIGADFLAVIIYRDPRSRSPIVLIEDEILYILDLKKKTLAKKIDVVGQGYYVVSPSATTSSFVVTSWSANTEIGMMSLYNYNKKNRSWSLAIEDVVDSGSSSSFSTQLLPGYFVNTVSRDNTLWLDVYKY
jgi:hypothetical protein